jgi:hypothetical protein
METYITPVWNWIKSNMLIAGAIAIVLILVLFPKLLGGLFRTRRVRHRRVMSLPYRRRRSLPRSVGVARHRTKGAKKAWQIKGSPAARRHMAQIRRMR